MYVIRFSQYSEKNVLPCLASSRFRKYFLCSTFGDSTVLFQMHIYNVDSLSVKNKKRAQQVRAFLDPNIER